MIGYRRSGLRQRLSPTPLKRRGAPIAWAASLAAAALLCLLAAGAPAASDGRARGADLAVTGSAHLAQRFVLPAQRLQGAAFLAEPTPPPQQWLPLVLKDHYRLPPWSGTARLGFGVVRNPIEEYDVSPLGADWYVDFGFRSDPPPLFDMEYVQTIRLSESGYSPDQATIEEYARAQPGTLYLIGNEPDAPIQDCVTPHTYAQRYDTLYGIIKGADPTAKVAIGGVVQATPLRLQYLDMILDEYQMHYGVKIPVDVWNVHGFILQEKKDSWGCQIPCGIKGVTEGMLYTVEDHDNMTIFRRQIRDFRIWMKDHGERNKPLIVSEYGILMPSDLGFDEPRVQAFMLATFDYFLNAKVDWLGYPADENRLVQAWAWYSLDDDHFEGNDTRSHLFNPITKQLTSLGRAYQDYTSSLP
ncbi:MAG TPA: hypothetical protein VJ714_07605 [Anaerolineae bacterium]|nr:hypothetical protein [Anaerolineae bacterium]